MSNRDQELLFCQSLGGAAMSMPGWLNSLCCVEIKLSVPQVTEEINSGGLSLWVFCTCERCAFVILSLLPARRGLIAVIRMGVAH